MSLKFDQLPSAIRRRGRLARLGPHEVPALLIPPEGQEDAPPPPMVVWIHGRTACKELDPGRYLRLMRSGMAVCAVDLPGHGERSVPALQESGHVLGVVLQMVSELDDVVHAAVEALGADPERVGLGGMSAGGMVTLARLCRPHRFRAASVEATTGNWRAQAHLPMLKASDAAAIAEADPIEHLDGWREIPLQAFHCRADEWVAFDGQDQFIQALRSRYRDPDAVTFSVFERTGAPNEHAGFGRYSAEVKEEQRLFFEHHLGATGNQP
ncbi:MAG: alpha/beta fold hydrolase [Phycisphaerales bacterium]|nr:alpha/beta fold hydrolase [Phycisphaerales bacterium]